MHDFEQTIAPQSEAALSFRITVDDLAVATAAQQWRERLCELVERCQRDKVTRIGLDFCQIDRISSAGLNELIAANTFARTHGVRLVLIDVCEPVRDVFKLTRLERMFEFTAATVEC